MKRILISSLLVFTTGVCAYSQAALLVLIFGEKAATENFHFSLDGGLNFSNFTHVVGTTNISANFGLGVYVKINDKWAFVPEFKPLSRKGEKGLESFLQLDESVRDELDELESKIVLNYIDVPLLLRYQISERFYTAAGPQISFRTTANLITEAVVKADQTEIEINNDLKDQSEWYDLGLAVEIGYHMYKPRVGSGVDIKARWAPGFKSVVDESVTGEEIQTNTFQVILSFPFLKSEE